MLYNKECRGCILEGGVLASVYSTSHVAFLQQAWQRTEWGSGSCWDYQDRTRRQCVDASAHNGERGMWDAVVQWAEPTTGDAAEGVPRVGNELWGDCGSSWEEWLVECHCQEWTKWNPEHPWTKGTLAHDLPLASCPGLPTVQLLIARMLWANQQWEGHQQWRFEMRARVVCSEECTVSCWFSALEWVIM